MPEAVAQESLEATAAALEDQEWEESQREKLLAVLSLQASAQGAEPKWTRLPLRGCCSTTLPD